MTESLSDWLALREPADRAARSDTLARRVAEMLPSHRPVRIVDLAAGTGANRRYLVTRLPRPQHWVLADRDPVLLAEARRSPACADHIEIREMDLGPVESLDICSGCHLVTASALLDLVSETWLQTLALRCGAEGAAVATPRTRPTRQAAQRWHRARSLEPIPSLGEPGERSTPRRQR